MDYLVIEGYKEAAENFARESGMNDSSSNPSMDFESIQNRMIIRNAIQSGDIVDAIERVNDFDPEVGFFSFSLPPPTSSAMSFNKTTFKIYPYYTTVHRLLPPRHDYNTMHHSQAPA